MRRMWLAKCLTCGTHARSVDGVRWTHHGRGGYRDHDHGPVVPPSSEWRLFGQVKPSPAPVNNTAFRRADFNGLVDRVLQSCKFEIEPVTICQHTGELRVERLLCGCVKHITPCNGWINACVGHGGRVLSFQVQSPAPVTATEVEA